MNIKYFTTGAVLCALGMTGCSKEVEEVGTQVDQQTAVTLRAIVGDQQTRAFYTENTADETKMAFSWRNGDEISLVVPDIDANRNVKLTTNDTDKSATFSGTASSPWEGEKSVYAFYPYSNTSTYSVVSAGASAEPQVQLTLPNPQSYTIGENISNSFMVGVVTATATAGKLDATVHMKQVMSIVKLKITNAPAKVTKVRLKDKLGNDIFPTSGSVNPSTAVTSGQADKTSTLSMNVTDREDGATKEVSLAMFPADLTGNSIYIEVMFADGTAKTITKEGQNFERNMHYVVNFDATFEPISTNGITFKTNLEAAKYSIDPDKNGIRLLSPYPVGSNGPVSYGDPKTWFAHSGNVTDVQLGDLTDTDGTGITKDSDGTYTARWSGASIPNLEDITKVALVTTVKNGVKTISKCNVTLEGQYILWNKTWSTWVTDLVNFKADSKGRILTLRGELYRVKPESNWGEKTYPTSIFTLGSGWKITKISASATAQTTTTPWRSLNDGRNINASNGTLTIKTNANKTSLTLGTMYPWNDVFADFIVTIQKNDITRQRALRVIQTSL